MIEVDQAQELPEFALRSWLRKIADVPDLLVKWTYALCIDSMSQKVQAGNSEHTLRKVDDHAVIAEALEDLAKV